MKIAVINGSPKGKYSITLQTVLYLQRKCPEHTFQVLNEGMLAPYTKLFAKMDKEKEN